MSDEKKLEPCPFCGSNDIQFGKKYVACRKCGCQTGFQDDYDKDGVLLAAWNTRTAPPHHITVTIDTRTHSIERIPDVNVVIDIEKKLCKLLGRDWQPSGISVVSLVDELVTAAPSHGEDKG